MGGYSDPPYDVTSTAFPSNKCRADHRIGHEAYGRVRSDGVGPMGRTSPRSS